MLNKIIHFSLQNRILVLVASVLLLIGGTYTAFHTEVDVFPDLNAPTVVIMTEANGMAAEEVEQLVTFPVETAVNGATHVRRVRSSSTNGFSVVWVEFEWDTDIYLARQIVSEKLSLVSEELPENVGKPTMGPQSSILGELLIIGLTSDTTSMLDLRTLADWTIRPRLLSTGGVAQVAVLGGDIKEYQVLLDPARMKHYNVTLAEVMNVTRNMNQNANGGVIYEYGNEYIVRGVLSSHDVAQLSRSVIKTVEGVPVTLEDIADVKIGSQEPKLGTASERGKPAVLLTVTKQPKTGTIELTEQLEAALKDLQKNLPADVHVSTDIFRQSRFIESSIGNVKDSLYEGAVFVVIVLFLFLANVRTTVISLVTLPLSLIVSILTLHYMGLTINTMSLGGMAIAIGSLVDDAIVVVEAVQAKFDEGYRSPYKATVAAMDGISAAIVTTSLVFMAVFIPASFMGGTSGVFYTQFGLTMAVAVGISAINALTLSPALCALIMTPHMDKSTGGKLSFSSRFHHAFEASFNRLVLKYKNGVSFFLRRKWMAWVSLAAVCALLVFFMRTTKTGLVPDEDMGTIFVNVTTPPGSSLAQTRKTMEMIDERIREIPQIKIYSNVTGYSMMGGQAASGGMLIIKLKHWDERQEAQDHINAIIAAIYQHTADIKSAKLFAFAQPTIMGYGMGSGFEMYVQDRAGGSVENLQKYTQDFIAALNRRPEISMAYTTFDTKYSIWSR